MRDIDKSDIQGLNVALKEFNKLHQDKIITEKQFISTVTVLIGGVIENHVYNGMNDAVTSRLNQLVPEELLYGTK